MLLSKALRNQVPLAMQKGVGTLCSWKGLKEYNWDKMLALGLIHVENRMAFLSYCLIYFLYKIVFTFVFSYLAFVIQLLT